MLLTLILWKTSDNEVDFQVSKNKKNQHVLSGSSSTTSSSVGGNIENISPVANSIKSKKSDLTKTKKSFLTKSKKSDLTTSKKSDL